MRPVAGIEPIRNEMRDLVCDHKDIFRCSSRSYIDEATKRKLIQKKFKS